MVLGGLGKLMQKNEIGLLFYTTHKNELRMDYFSQKPGLRQGGVKKIITSSKC